MLEAPQDKQGFYLREGGEPHSSASSGVVLAADILIRPIFTLDLG